MLITASGIVSAADPTEMGGEVDATFDNDALANGVAPVGAAEFVARDVLLIV